MYTTHIIILRSVNHEVRVCMDPRTDTFRYIGYTPKIFITLVPDPSDTKRYITAVLTLTPHTRSRLFLCRSMRQTGCRYTRDYGYKKSGVGILFLFSSFKNQANQTCIEHRSIEKMSECTKTDVFISGGGPVGLLIAYSLARQGVQSILVGKSDPLPPYRHNAPD